MLIAIRGLMVFVTFDDEGKLTEAIQFGVSKDGEELSLGVDVPAGIWHTIIALKQGSILLEVKAGPFDAHKPKDLAPWAPEENSIQATQYLQMLLAQVNC
jgi:cupin fold WbuC family metalloprotein